jgi:hypothetical protein
MRRRQFFDYSELGLAGAPCFLINYKKLVEKKDCEDLVSKMQIIEGGFGLHRQRRPRENRSGIG